jgi:dipeptide/tripeptide permease
MTWVAFGIAFLGCILLMVVHTKNEFVKALPVSDGMMTSGISAEDVRKAFACVPAIVCINLGFNVPYNAMNNAYPAQACQMNTVVFGKQLNGAFFTLGDALAIIIVVPIVEMLVYPALARCRGREATRTEKYTAGFGFCILANVIACVIEYERRGMSSFVLCPEDLLHTSSCTPGSAVTGTPSYWLSSCSPGGSLPMTDLSAFWCFVPMVLTGVGEIFVNPVIYQYVFENAPASLRSILQALNLVVAGSISNAVTAALGPLIPPEDFNKGHLVYYFYANIVIGVLSLVAYWVIAHVQKMPEAEDRTGVLSSVIASVNHGSALLGQAGSVVEGTGFGSQRRSLLGSTVNS